MKLTVPETRIQSLQINNRTRGNLKYKFWMKLWFPTLQLSKLEKEILSVSSDISLLLSSRVDREDEFQLATILTQVSSHLIHALQYRVLFSCPIVGIFASIIDYPSLYNHKCIPSTFMTKLPKFFFLNFRKYTFFQSYQLSSNNIFYNFQGIHFYCVNITLIVLLPHLIFTSRHQCERIYV